MRRTLVALLLLLCLPLAARAADPVPAPAAAQISPEDMQRAVALLKDDQQRTDFLAKLQALVDAQKAVTPPPPEAPTPVGLVGELLSKVTDTVGAMSSTLGSAALALGDLPQAWTWVRDQAGDPALLQRWGALVWKLAAILAAGFVARWIATRLLRPVRRRMSGGGVHRPIVKILLLLVRAALDLAELAAFAAAAYLCLPLVEPTYATRLVAVTLVNAILLVGLTKMVARIILAPGLPALRLGPMGDETAAYLYVWVCRLIDVSVYGYFGIQAAYLLGMERNAFTLLTRILGLVITTMLIIFVLQNRQPVADWLRAERPVRPGRRSYGMRGVGRRLADIWHIVAMIYVVIGFLVWAIGVGGGFGYLMRVTVMSLVVIGIARLIDGALGRLVSRGFAVGGEFSSRLPGLQGRANRYLPLLSGVMRGVIIVITMVLLLQVWGADAFAWLASAPGRHLLSSAVSILLVLGMSGIFWEIASSAIERYLTEVDASGARIQRSARVRTLLPLLRNALMVVLVTVVGLIVLSELGVNIAPLLAGAGVVGLAIGFGAQTLVKDVITGLFLLFEDTIRVGDVVEVGGKSGTVQSMTIRAINLRDSSGNLISVPFSAVTLVLNMTKDFSYNLIDVAVPRGHTPGELQQILQEIDAELRADPELGPLIQAPLEFMGLDRFEGDKPVMRARVRTAPGSQWRVRRAYNDRLQTRLIEHGIWEGKIIPQPASS